MKTVALLLVLTACTGGSSTEPEPTTTPVDATAPATTTTTTTTSTSTATSPPVQCNVFPACPQGTENVASAAACPPSPRTCQTVSACGHTIYCASE